MTNISFDNPYLLIVAIPLLALVLVPYFITFRKENRSKSTVASLVLHVVMVGLISLALAGLHTVTVNTQTEVLIVADVSYSTERDADKTDAYIKELLKEGNLPKNCKAGVVCFGRDAALNTPFGGVFETVKGSGVDNSLTDISGALEYAAGLFSPDSVKRIVLVTDGKQNTADGSSGLLNSVKNMENRGILVDAVYTDSNLGANEYEVQLSAIEYVSSTYLNREAQVEIFIQSNTDYVPNSENPKDKNDSFIRLYNAQGELVSEISRPLHKGFNLITMKLDTSVAGVTDYKIVVEAEHDTSYLNNTYSFTHTVEEKHKILLISQKDSDLEKAQELYGEFSEIHAPMIVDRYSPIVPYTLEELCKYDEFIVSDIDVKLIPNATAFIANLNTAVSKFGKTLITAGNMYVQNQEGVLYDTLGNMMAIQYGNSASNARLYTIVIDTSRSMINMSKLIIAKESAIQLLNLLQPEDNVILISFAGDSWIIKPATPVSHKDELISAIDSITPTQGTVIGAGLRLAYDQMKEQSFSEKHVFLISDGRSYTGVGESDDPVVIASEMYNKKKITTSVINTSSAVGEDLLGKIQKAGKGNYYLIETPEQIQEKISTDIADDINETVIEKETPVIIEDYNDPLVSGITTLPSVNGYYYGEAKSNAKVVLSVDYRKSASEVLSVPLCSYWKYGTGKVVSLSTSFSGSWVSLWDSDADGKAVFNRLLSENMPKERVDYPFTVNTLFDGSNVTLEILPGENNTDIYVDIEVVSPSGEKTMRRLYYDSGRYCLVYEAKEVGKYSLNVGYTYGSSVFSAALSFDVPYYAEYDRFELFSSAVLHNAIGGKGTVSEGSTFKIVNPEGSERSETVYLTAWLMAFAVLLYVADITVRKIKWTDIKSFFKRRSRGEGAQ